jgi:guanine deaminase
MPAFNDHHHCHLTAKFFIDELLRNGTTSALVLPTVHVESVSALFETAEKKEMRIVSGKILMDRNAPPELRDTAEQSYVESRLIMERWHMRNRMSCAVIPRFALTSSEKQLEVASALIKETPGLLFHSHLSENQNEVKSIAACFPWSRSYLDVYDHYGLTGPKSIFAHGIHLDDTDYRCLADTGSSVALCPTSNMFLGSGLFDYEKMEKHKIRLGLGTDVGAGTSFSMFKTMAEAYKVCQLKGNNLSPAQAFYMATLGGADILGIGHKVGNFEKGKEADFIVINPGKIPILERRIANACHLEEILFALMILGDDRIIEHCHILGEDRKPAHSESLNADIG